MPQKIQCLKYYDTTILLNISNVSNVKLTVFSNKIYSLTLLPMFGQLLTFTGSTDKWSL